MLLLHLLSVTDIRIDVEEDADGYDWNNYSPKAQRRYKAAYNADQAHSHKEPATKAVSSLPHHCICQSPRCTNTHPEIASHFAHVVADEYKQYRDS